MAAQPTDTDASSAKDLSGKYANAVDRRRSDRDPMPSNLIAGDLCSRPHRYTYV